MDTTLFIYIKKKQQQPNKPKKTPFFKCNLVQKTKRLNDMKVKKWLWSYQ